MSCYVSSSGRTLTRHGTPEEKWVLLVPVCTELPSVRAGPSRARGARGAEPRTQERWPARARTPAGASGAAARAITSDMPTAHAVNPQPMADPVGVCVVGEARSFALPAFRASLRSLLDALAVSHPPVLSFQLSRSNTIKCVASSSHRKECAMVLSWRFEMSEAQLRAEFPEVEHVTLTNSSRCEQLHEPCCRLSQRQSRHRPVKEPTAYLQYAGIATCVRGLLGLSRLSRPSRDGRRLSHIIRTRPDVLYLEPTSIAAAVLASREPLVARKGDSGALAEAGGDWFLSSPAAQAGDFFEALVAPIRRECVLGRLDMATSTQPETVWQPAWRKRWLGPSQQQQQSMPPFRLVMFRLTIAYPGRFEGTCRMWSSAMADECCHRVRAALAGWRLAHPNSDDATRGVRLGRGATDDDDDAKVPRQASRATQISSAAGGQRRQATLREARHHERHHEHHEQCGRLALPGTGSPATSRLLSLAGGTRRFDRYSTALACGARSFLFSRRDPRNDVERNQGWHTIVRAGQAAGAYATGEAYGEARIALEAGWGLSHNAAFLCEEDGTIVAYGGQPSRKAERKSGIQRVTASSADWPLRWSRPQLVLSGQSGGCMEWRSGFLRAGCEFDGRLSVLRHCSRVLMFSRANLGDRGGARHVQVASSVDGVSGWSEWQPLILANYSIAEGNNIYFFAVSHVQPTRDREGRLVALFPAVIGGVGGVYMALGLDSHGVRWTRPVLLMRAATTSMGRTGDHPVGLQSDCNRIAIGLQSDCDHPVGLHGRSRTAQLAKQLPRGIAIQVEHAISTVESHGVLPFHCEYSIDASAWHEFVDAELSAYGDVEGMAGSSCDPTLRGPALQESVDAIAAAASVVCRGLSWAERQHAPTSMRRWCRPSLPSRTPRGAGASAGAAAAAQVAAAKGVALAAHRGRGRGVAAVISMLRRGGNGIIPSSSPSSTMPAKAVVEQYVARLYGETAAASSWLRQAPDVVYVATSAWTPSVAECPAASGLDADGGRALFADFNWHAPLGGALYFGRSASTRARPHAMVPSHAWAEVTRCGGSAYERAFGAWHYVMRGSGLSVNVGRTIAFGCHGEAAAHFLGRRCERWQCDDELEALGRAAKAAGYDSLQFVAHCDDRCEHCGHELMVLVDGGALRPRSTMPWLQRRAIPGSDDGVCNAHIEYRGGFNASRPCRCVPWLASHRGTCAACAEMRERFVAAGMPRRAHPPPAEHTADFERRRASATDKFEAFKQLGAPSFTWAARRLEARCYQAKQRRGNASTQAGTHTQR